MSTETLLWPFGQKKEKTPAPAPAPPPPPPVIEESDMEMLDEDIIQRRKKLSRPKTILTGDLTPQNTGKKRLLGG